MAERNDLIPFEHEAGKQPRRYAVATEDELKELEVNFPEPFVDYVRRHGWCSSSGGLFWMVSPRYLAPALADWQLDAPVQAFGRNALGDIYALCRGKVVLLYCSGGTLALSGSFLGFLNYGIHPQDTLCKSDVKELQRELGPLRWDECYTYSPSLAIKADVVRKAEKGKLAPYVSIIGQLVAPVKIAESVARTDQPVEGFPEDLGEELMSLVEDAKVKLEKRKKEKGY
jgi:hypothetical protein